MKFSCFLSLLIVSTLLLSFTSTSQADESSNSDQPPLIVYDQCPFECCKFGQWTAESALVAFKLEGDISNVAFNITPGEKFSAITGNIHITKPGIIKVMEPFDVFQKNDIIHVLSYQGEGYYTLWHKGKFVNFEDIIFSKVDFIDTPDFEWWVSIQNNDGAFGWLRLVNTVKNGFLKKEKIDGMDGCE